MTSEPARNSALHALTAQVQSIIDGGRIGAPVFVRWTARIPPERHADDAVGEAVAAVAQWFADQPQQVHQPGGSPRHASVHARWANGAAALIAAGPCLPGSRPGIDVAVFGATGAIYHDGQAIRRLDLQV